MKTIQQNNPDSTEVLALLIGEVDDDSRNIYIIINYNIQGNKVIQTWSGWRQVIRRGRKVARSCSPSCSQDYQESAHSQSFLSRQLLSPLTPL